MLRIVDSRALANDAESVVENRISDVAAQISNKYMIVVACVLLVIVRQGPVHTQLLAKVALAVQGLEGSFCRTALGKSDKAITSTRPTGLVLMDKR